MKRLLSLFCFVMLNAAFPTAHAGLVVEMNEIGSDIIANGSGTLNLSAMTLSGPRWESHGGMLIPVDRIAGPDFRIGRPAPEVNKPLYDRYIGPWMTGPNAYGTISSIFHATSGSGDNVGVLPHGLGSTAILMVPAGYVSGGPLSSSSTWQNRSLSSMGVTPGTYTWAWGSGANSDFIQLNIRIAAVPEPGSIMLVGLLLLGSMVVTKIMKYARSLSGEAE